ncbi:hypothetical protein [Arenibaculum sp.]|jgi:cytochrome b561|uniref:hypothetical protein n=1 Tax=Arenibaculum sp. TaxID=2865862 RepID=UPI002E14B20E|nr:hypothetical protein [Arenibaculum sp.]
MLEHLYVESLVGFGLFILSVAVARPLRRFYLRTPTPALLRGETRSELILLGYFCLVLLSFVVGIHGLI